MYDRRRDVLAQGKAGWLIVTGGSPERVGRSFTENRTLDGDEVGGMFELNIKAVREAMAGAALPLPEPFILAGYGSPYVIPASGQQPLLIDAEGVVLGGGAVFVWCHSGCCGQPRQWPSVQAAADYHGSFILDPDGVVRPPDDLDDE